MSCLGRCSDGSRILLNRLVVSHFISRLEIDLGHLCRVHFYLVSLFFKEIVGNYLETEEGFLSLTEME